MTVSSVSQNKKRTARAGACAATHGSRSRRPALVDLLEGKEGWGSGPEVQCTLRCAVHFKCLFD